MMGSGVIAKNDPRRPALHAGLLEQQRQGHSGPFAATGHPMRLRHCLMRGSRTVSNALEKMNAGYGREALQLLHGERQRTVHHSVDHETMLLGIDVRNVEATVGRHIMERGWRDTPYRLPKRSHYVKRKPKGIGRRSPFRWLAYRGHETGALAIGDQLLDIFFSGRRYWCLAARSVATMNS